MGRTSKWAVGSMQWAVSPQTSSCAHSPIAHRPLPTAHSSLPTAHLRGGMTLVELLITMAIIAILSAAILGTASAAMEAGRRSRTQGVITRLNGLLMERWDSYANRKVVINPNITTNVNDQGSIEYKFRSGQINATQRGQMLADARLLALRELMKMEMPDRWSDIVNQPLDNDPTSTLLNDPTILATVPPVTQTYYRRLRGLETDDRDVALSNQGAECLYMTIMFHTGDGEARTLFSAQDIGDTDGDGAQEFLDGWGNPIQFIRWPAGFVHESVLMTGDADADHDPFDVFRRDSPGVKTPPNPDPSRYPSFMQDPVNQMRQRNVRANATAGQFRGDIELGAFRLVPLIYSIGPDEDSDLMASPLATTELDPYADRFGDDNDVQLGFPSDQEDDGEGWQDNIHNQLNEY